MTSSSTIWSTRSIRPGRQFAQWREAVSETHLNWEIAKRRDGEFFGSIRRHTLGPASIIACTCDPCSGRRGPPQIRSAEEDYFGVLLIVGGEERFGQGRNNALLRPGDFAVWDSRRPIEFAIGSRLDKITLLVPQRLLLGDFPRLADHVARTVSGRNGGGALFANHLRLLARERANLPETSVPGLLASTLNLLSAALTPHAKEDKDARSVRQRDRLDRIQAHILLHLGDPALNPGNIAKAIGVSVRQLHRVFAEAGLRVERWIWQERLTRCRSSLLQNTDEPVSQIAFRWGFNDSAHFSRAFREQYGQSPRELRRSRCS